MRDNRPPLSPIPQCPNRPTPAIRAPLFLPALTFAGGCTWGFGSPALFWPALAMVFLLGVLWLRSRRETGSLLSFLGIVLFLGVGSAAFHKGWRPADDLRRLPRSKFQPDCRWEGTIQSVPLEKEREGSPAATAILGIRRAWLSGAWRPASGRVLLEVRSGPGARIVLGQRLSVRGGLRRPGAPRNPGEPDWREILSVHRIAYRLPASWRDIVPLDTGSWTGRSIAAARRWARRLLQAGIESDPQAVALLSGMIYGQTGGLPAKTEEEFRLAGAYHVFAVSGQNVTAVLAVGLALYEAGRISRWRWGCALLPVVAFYALLSGGSASAARAAFLSALVLVAWLVRRPIRLLNLWAAALLLFLGLDPLSVRDVSLQLSFGVVLALLLLGPPLAAWMSAPFRPDPFIPRTLLPRRARLIEALGGGAALLLASSLAASMGALPFEILHFHFVSLIGPFANLLIVPLAELIMTVGVLSLSLGSLCPLFAVLLNNANWLFAHLLLATVSFASHLPAAGIAAPDPRALLSRSSALQLFFPAIPLGSACLIRSEGKVFLVCESQRSVCLARVEPIRRFYGWNWLDGELRQEGETWLAAPRRPWGTDPPLAPFEQLHPTGSLRLEPGFDSYPTRYWVTPRPVLLIAATGYPVLVLGVSPSRGEIPPAMMDLSLTPRADRPAQRLRLILRPDGAWLAEDGSPHPPVIVRSLGNSAVEVRLYPRHVAFRPYRGRPVFYPAAAPQGDGAANQIPSSPEGVVQ
ncbi:conserved membrane protein of unknown function [Methylacidimicrobium sp. AP8]|uniref:ComEC family competence protein n=1 Tax=Methylacidimicrobium sp. AP8 TaxID=2730359 RepID=UPI0018C15975|nr:ComEC family competence protein [Methylacidimicrobium sp. AP8]CAB4244681.1 conserved membrane protein of unknown function [Methylacidimicrobium sp. AP8]